MQAPSVPKIKKFLADIKSRWLDNVEAANDPEGMYFALLKMELLLRGVIVEEDKKLWEAILSSVGKPLLNECMAAYLKLSISMIVCRRMGSCV